MNMEAGRFSPGAANEERKDRVKAAIDTLGEHRVVSKLRPEMLGEGGEHVVFSVEGLPKDVVAKVRRSNVFEALRLQAEGKDLKRFRLLLQAALRKERGSINMAKKYLGQFVLRERVAVMDVPATSELLKVLAKDGQKPPEVPSGVHEVPALVILQDRAPQAAFGPESMGAQTYYLESHDTVINGEADELYTELNRRFLDCEDSDDSDAGIRVLSFREKEEEPSEAEQLLARTEEDPALRAMMTDFVGAAIKFSQETGGIVDFIGSNNIRVYPEHGTDGDAWRMVLMDARQSGGVFIRGREAVGKMIKREAMTDDEIICAEIAVNYVRYLNAWAQGLGMSERLHLLDVPIAEHSGQMLAYFRLLHPAKDQKATKTASDEHVAAK